MSKQERNMRKIAFEEHFTTEEQSGQIRDIIEKKYPVKKVNQEEEFMNLEIRWVPTSDQSGSLVGSDVVMKKLLDTGKARLKDMDEADIAIQVLSLVSPGVQMLDTATAVASMKRTNDYLADVIKKQPDRYVGLATMAPHDPKKCAAELERAITKLGFRGACINSQTKGEYLDDKKFWPIFEVAENLDVPIYIHARIPSPQMVKAYMGYPGLALAFWGYGAETSLHAVRLICSGVFEKYPKLKIVLGHMGEALPFWLWRLDRRWKHGAGGSDKYDRIPSEYFRDNFYITTSGNFWFPALQEAMLAIGADKIMFAVDYPFESNKEGAEFMDSVTISHADKEKICFRNAEKLLKL
jgi:predicted TIM-barrel fold metal-dependent hydrolase